MEKIWQCGEKKKIQSEKFDMKVSQYNVLVLINHEDLEKMLSSVISSLMDV